MSKNVIFENLAAADIHIWKINLDKSDAYLNENRHLLSKSEIEKSQRLFKQLHQKRAIAMKAQLRLILSRYVDQPAKSIQFAVAEFGKPYIESSVINFNVSHSQGKALVVISLSENIGVDIECWREIDNAGAIVQRHYSESEKSCWARLPDTQKITVFFDIWTRKEAFIKATGRGLALGLSKCSFDVEKTGQLIACPQQYGKATSWSVHSLNLGGKVSASLVIKGSNHRLKIIEA